MSAFIENMARNYNRFQQAKLSMKRWKQQNIYQKYIFDIGVNWLRPEIGELHFLIVAPK